MDAQRILSVLDTYDLELKQMAAHARLQGLKLTPERSDVNLRYIGLGVTDQMTKLSHVWWAIGQCRTFVLEERMPKAFRWLGFIQGALWMHGIYAIEELASHNKPPAEELNTDPNRK